jgi:hypothetical protein
MSTQNAASRSIGNMAVKCCITGKKARTGPGQSHPCRGIGYALCSNRMGSICTGRPGKLRNRYEPGRSNRQADDTHSPYAKLV